MGLTIHFEIRLPAIEPAAAEQLVRDMHRRLATHPSVRALPPTTDPVELGRRAMKWILVRHADSMETVEGIPVPPLEGCIFPVQLGQDCELLWLGLCRYPAAVVHGSRSRRTRLGTGWRFAGACKTQYASLQGWDHFRHCHTTAITLLRAWSEVGARVRIHDEGGWWPHRSDAALRQALDTMNQTVAGLAGALRDASGDSGESSVVSPIFSHPRFETLEAEGVQRHGETIACAARLVRDLPGSKPGKDRPEQ